jgi:hypothetical protein
MLPDDFSQTIFFSAFSLYPFYDSRGEICQYQEPTRFRPVFVFELRSEIGAGLVPANQFFQLGADCFRDRDATR